MLVDLGPPAAGAVRAVLFDFFGTLTRAVVRGPEHAHVARVLGVDPSALGTVLDETFYRRATGQCGDLPGMLRVLAGALGITATDEQVEAARAARLAVLCRDAQLRADAVDTLAELRSRG